MTQIGMPGIEPGHQKGDALERDYTPQRLADLCVETLAASGLDPRRVVEAHVGGGAWIRAVRRVWPRSEILALDVDRHASGLLMREVDYCAQLDATTEQAKSLIHGWVGSDERALIVGNPPFEPAKDHLYAMREAAARAHVAWILPWDQYSALHWAELLINVFPPLAVYPITGRVWPFVRGVALWVWGPGDDWDGETRLRPIQYK